MMKSFLILTKILKGTSFFALTRILQGLSMQDHFYSPILPCKGKRGGVDIYTSVCVCVCARVCVRARTGMEFNLFTEAWLTYNVLVSGVQ